MKLRGVVIFNLFLILVFVIGIVLALGFNSRARLAPLVIAIPGFVVSSVRLVLELKGGKKSKDSASIGISPSESEEAAAKQDIGQEGAVLTQTEKTDNLTLEEQKAALWIEINPFIWITGLFVLIYLAGFMVAIPVFLFLFMKVRSKEKLLFSILFSLISWGALYLFFGMLLKIPLYSGVIAETFF